MMRTRWTVVAGWFVASRLVILGLGAVGAASFVNHRTGAAVENVAALDPETVWHKWDSLWYERVATHGYAHELDTPQGQAAAGFFPLYPLTVRAVRAIVPFLSFFWVGAILSNLFTVAALVLLARSLLGDADAVGRVMALMMTSAGSFYLSIPYTEGLFLLLVVVVLIATRGRHYEAAGLAAGLAATTRAHGLAALAIPIVACWLDEAHTAPARLRRTLVTALLFGLPVLGYLAYLSQALGSWDAFITRQTLWDNPSPYPGQAIVGFFTFPRRIAGWLHGGFWVLYLGLLLRYWRRLPPGDALFCLGVFLITTQQDIFHGTYRYVVPLVPLTLAIARDRDPVQCAIIAVNLIFGTLMILAFVTWNRIAV